MSHEDWVPSWTFGFTVVAIPRTEELMLAVECVLGLWRVLD